MVDGSFIFSFSEQCYNAARDPINQIRNMNKIILISLLILIGAGLVCCLGLYKKPNGESLTAGLFYSLGFNQNSNNELLPDPQNQMTDLLKTETLQEGTGQVIANGQTAVVHYTGTLLNGTKFDSSLDRGEPFSFKLGQGLVIAGWEQGILGMKVGEKRKLTIAPELGYGSHAIGNVIPANSTLVFEVELLEIK